MNLVVNYTSVRNRFKVFRRIVYFILFLLFAIILIMFFYDMEDVVEGNGTVVGIREYDLKTIVSSRVSKVLHHEGEEVERDEILLEFDSKEKRDEISRLRSELAELEQKLAVKQDELKILRRDPLPDYYRHTKLQMEEAKERLVRNENELSVYKDLFKRQAVTRRELLKVELDHLSSRMALERLTADWERVKTGMLKDIMAKAENELKLLEKQVASKKNDIKIAESHLDDYLLRAPDAGVVTDIPPRPGGYYAKGETVVKFSANRNKKVIAMIDEKQIFKVARGHKVRIYCQQYNYLDYGSFPGTVTDVYQLPVTIGKLNYYPVRIVLDKEPYPLRFGSGCEVKIVTGHDKIICVVLGIRGEDFWKRRGIKRK